MVSGTPAFPIAVPDRPDPGEGRCVMSDEEGLPPQEALFGYLNEKIAHPLETIFLDGSNRDVFHQQVRLYVEEDNLREARKEKARQALADAEDAITKECQDLKSGARKRRRLTYPKHPPDKREWLWRDARGGGCGWIRREVVDEAATGPWWWERPFSEPAAFAVLMALHDKIRPGSDPMLPDDVRASLAMQDILRLGLEDPDLHRALEAAFMADEDAKDPRTLQWGRQKADLIRSYFKYVQQYFACAATDPEAPADGAGGPDVVAGPTQGKKIPWSDDAPDFISSADAVRSATAASPPVRMEAYELSRLLAPDGEIRYMRNRKRNRCSVHGGDWLAYIKKRQREERRFLKHDGESRKAVVKRIQDARRGGPHAPADDALSARRRKRNDLASPAASDVASDRE